MPPNRDPTTGRFTSSGGGTQLGNAYGVITIDTSGIDAAIDRAVSAVGRIPGAIQPGIDKLLDSVGNIAGNLTALTAPLMVAGGAGVKAAADFDVLLTQIEVFGNVAPDQMEKVRQYALQMGADTKFASSDAAAAMLDLLKSGQSLEQAMAALPEVLNLAAAGEIGLAEAAGIVSSGLAVFKLGAEDAARVSNALARAANASRADVRGLGQALNNVGPVAAQFNLSIEDTSAVLGVFAQNGIMGAEAGTQLRSMLLNMSEQTPKTKAAWDELNISMYDSQGNMRDFNTIIKELDAALDKLPVEDQNRLMAQLGGSYGIVGLSALRAAGGIDSMRASMAEAPEAASIAERFMDTFKGKIESLMGSIETLQITALTPFMNDFLAPLADRVIEVVNATTQWVEANQPIAQTIIRIIAVVGALAPIIWGATKAIQSAISIFRALATIVGLVTSPIGLLIAAIAGLVWAFQNNFLGIRDFLQPIIENIVGGFQTLFGVLGNLGNIVDTQGIGAAIDYILNAFAQMFGLVDSGDFFEPLRGFGDGIVGAFLSVVSFIQANVLPVLQQVGDWFINTALPAIITFVTTVAIPAIGSFFNFLGQAWSVIGPALFAIADWFINTALPLIISYIQTVVVPAFQGWFNFLGQVWAVIGPALASLYDWFVTTALPAIVTYITDTVVPGVQTFIDQLVNFWTNIQPTLQSVYDWFITTGLPAIVTFITDTVVPGVQDFIDLVMGIWEDIQPTLQSVYDWFITSGLPAISDFITLTVVPSVQSFIDKVTAIWTLVEPGLTSLKNGMSAVFDWINTNVIQPAKTAFEQLLAIFNTLTGQSGGGSGGGIDIGGAVFNALFPNLALLGNVPGYASGIDYIPNQQIAMLHPGEAVLTAQENRARMEGGSGSSNYTINVMMPAAALESSAAAEESGHAFGKAIWEEVRSRG